MSRTFERTTLVALCGAALQVACGGDDSRQLDPEVLALSKSTPAFYDDGETQLFQTTLQVPLPIVRPTDAQREALRAGGDARPFPRKPWLTVDQVDVQVTWTLANLDPDTHAVEVLIDPWNEFGRYEPGFTQDGNDVIPNLSGIDELYELPGRKDGRSSRIAHTFTFEDMKELATDFAAAVNILENVQPPAANPGEAPPEDPRIGLVNHVFNRENRTGSSPFTDRYVPATLPGLTGFDLSLRTREPASVVIEISVELVDHSRERVVEEGKATPTMERPGRTYSLAGG